MAGKRRSKAKSDTSKKALKPLTTSRRDRRMEARKTKEEQQRIELQSKEENVQEQNVEEQNEEVLNAEVQNVKEQDTSKKALKPLTTSRRDRRMEARKTKEEQQRIELQSKEENVQEQNVDEQNEEVLNAEVQNVKEQGWATNLANEEKWLRLPRGVKFEPTDQDIILHLLAEIGEGEAKPHPFIGEFIKSWSVDDNHGYFFPHKLPGVKKDGNMFYFFHKPFKPQEIRSRKYREGTNDGWMTDFWHKFGSTKAVSVDGTRRGSKKKFVLCNGLIEHPTSKRTNWIMHQYHIGIGEDVEGNLAISKIFYIRDSKQGEKNAHNLRINSAETVMSLTNECQAHVHDSCMKSLAVPNQSVIMGTRHKKANAFQGDASHAMVDPCNCVQKNTMEDAYSIPVVSESRNDKVDSVTLLERYRLLLSNIDKVKHETLQQYESMLCRMNKDIGHHRISELAQGTGFGVPVGRNEAQMGDIPKCCETISATQNSSLLPNIDCTREIPVTMVKDEATDDQFLHNDAISFRSSVGHHVLSVSCCTNMSSETGPGKYHDQDTAQVKSMSIQENVIDTIKQDSYQMHDIFDYPDMNISISSLRDACLPPDASLNAPSPGVDHVEHLLKCNDRSQPSNTTLSIKTESLDELNMNSTLGKNAGESFNTLREMDMISQSEVQNSVLPVKPKLESMEINPLPIHENKIENHVMEMKSDDELDFFDDISLIERKQMLNFTSFTNMGRDANAINSLQTVLPPECDVPNDTYAKIRKSSSNRKRKRTATDSVEAALEEDAPGLLQVLLERGITAEEIKLYGEEESEEAISICSTDDSFKDFEAILAKLFPEVPSILKFPPVRKTKASKVHYCVACLLSLIKQARYLHFRRSLVEWGWCRDLQSFIFVFESHNRLVLERPEYGYATYFFELVESLPVDWQIKRLVTAMKLPCCSRTVLLENRPLIVGEDMTEGEAQVMEELGWIRNTGLGTMLRYCDRVVHDKKNENYSSEWNAKIGKLLMDGRDSGRTVLSNVPKRFKVEIEDFEVKQEPC